MIMHKTTTTTKQAMKELARQEEKKTHLFFTIEKTLAYTSCE